jgi:hypothetical protein
VCCLTELALLRSALQKRERGLSLATPTFIVADVGGVVGAMVFDLIGEARTWRPGLWLALRRIFPKAMTQLATGEI